ncbi:L,D-transpeptidase family protein [Streptomyces sp. NPDC046197]|uniref:L,D-transpeptidase family protein n=1 Tax=Streptomyces sp. NPDC046197 TaxID=3154337 RepID=UPI0033E2DA37
MRSDGARRATMVAACGFLLMALAVWNGPRTEVSHGGVPRPGGAESGTRSNRPEPPHLPGVGDLLWREVPADTGQVVVVYGGDRDSSDSTLALYERRGDAWERLGNWAAHNGRRGWAADHRAGDERTPVGVFTLSDAGGRLADPGTRLSYTQDEGAFVSPYFGDAAHWHDFDYVVAVDYNRRRGAPPYDPTRPEGQERGGGIWLHVDHGDGTLGCVSVPEAAMEYLLRVLDPRQGPVVVMGDEASLRS